MWPFTKKQIIYFLHIYKTGGTSVSDLLYRNYLPEEILGLYSKGVNGIDLISLVDLYENIIIPKQTRILYGHFAYGIHEKSDRPYSYMCFLREPIRRLVSMYFNYKRMDKQFKGRIFDEFSFYLKDGSNIDNFEELVNFDIIHNQQCMFLTGESSKDIALNPEYYAELAIKNICREFTFVGITELFDESVRLLIKKLGLESTAFVSQNFCNNKPLDFKIPEELLPIILNKSKADVIIYNYCKDHFYSINTR
ncbi:MAG: sulfotransferase family 2 domain-containing protein [Bacteroidales bacterium]|nr:sulfotransferase family 2 domain-containing protein [Bacteroidales bacterium]